MFKQISIVILLILSSWFFQTPEYPYFLQAGSPVAIQNFLYPETGCNWEGVGGQVFDLNGQPVSDLVIRVYGLYEEQPFYANVLTGVSKSFGPGGYEYQFGSSPLTSDGEITLQVFNLAGQALSTPVSLSTWGTCEGNLMIVNFKEISWVYNALLPFIKK